MRLLRLVPLSPPLTDFLSVGQRARERPSAAKRAIARESLAKVRIVMEIARIASETVLPLRGLTEMRLLRLVPLLPTSCPWGSAPGSARAPRSARSPARASRKYAL